MGKIWILTSAANYYEGVTQQEAEDFYAAMKTPGETEPVMYGMNSRLVKKDGVVQEEVWKIGACTEKLCRRLFPGWTRLLR